ncbi:hypothetical protein [Kitasatospora sp. NPDC004289]
MAGQLVDERPRDADGLWLVASARSRELAYDHAFVTALEAAVREATAGMRQRYLDIATVTSQVNDHLREHGSDQSASYHAVSGRAVPPFLPNPRYRPGLPDGAMDVQSQREWTAHFEPRGRGVEYVSERGDWFTGRRQALASLAGWLRDPVHDRRARVVTGDPGSGKSAVLGRLLALARPDHPEAPAHLLPPPDVVTASVHAHGTTLEQLTTRLAVALDVEADTPSQLLASLAAYEGSLRTVLIDALDEAGTGVEGREPQRIARELLRPMSVLPRLRLLIGTRRTTIPDLGRGVEVLDLDTDAYTGRDDIEEYARRTLAAMPGEVAEPERAALAKAVARRAGRSFLVARMTVRALLHGDLTIDQSRPGWEEQLPSEVGQAFDAYLARYGEDEDRVRWLLRPLAYAEGSGLPWDSLWAPLAAALSGEKCTDADVNWLLRQAGSYVVEVPVSEGRSVFRLYHEALAEHLRDPRRRGEDQRRMTAALIDSVAARAETRDLDWERAHPYVRAHLAGHAAASGDLGRLLEDPWFVVHAEPDPLVAAMEGVEGAHAQRVRTMYRTSAHLYRHLCVHERTQVMAVDSARYRLEEYRRALGERLVWKPRWATGSQTSTLYRGELSSWSGDPLLAVEFDGAPAVLIARDGGPVEIWDPAGQVCLASLDGHTRTVTAIHSVEVDGVMLVVTGADDGTVRVWDLVRTTELHNFAVRTEAEVAEWASEGYTGPIVAALSCVQGHDQMLIVGCSRDGSAWVRELASGQLRRELPGHPSAVRLHLDLLGTRVRGEPSALVQQPSGAVRLLNVDTGAWVELGDSEGCEAMASVVQDGVDLIALGFRGGALQFRDPDTGRVVFSCDLAPGWITALAFAELDGRAVMVLGYADGSMELRERAAGPAGRLLARLNGHADWVRSIAISYADGWPVAASSSSDGSVRLWRLEERPEELELHGHASTVSALACTVLDGSPAVVSASHDHTARVWDVSSGRELRRLEGHTAWVEEVTCTTVMGRPVAITSGRDRTVRMWSLADGSEAGCTEGSYGSPLAVGHIESNPVVVHHTGGRRMGQWDLGSLRIGGTFEVSGRFGVEALAWALLDGRPVAVVADYPGSGRRIGVWDLTEMTWIGDLEGQVGQVDAMAYGAVGPVPVVLAATIRHGTQVWDLRTRKQWCQLGNGGVSAVAFGVLDGMPVALTADHSAVQIWNLRDGALLDDIQLPARPGAVAFAPGGELVVGAGYEVIVLERDGRPSGPGGRR